MDIERRSRIRVLTLAAIYASAVFATRFLVPAGIAYAILYVPVVVITLWSPRRSDPLLAGAACTALAAAGAAFDGGGWLVWSNTALALLAIWISALGVRLSMRSQRELHDSEVEMRAIVDTVIDGVVTIDERGTISSVNPAVERMFGYGRAELVGRNVRVLMPAPYREEHDGYLETYRRTGRRNIIGIGREVVGLRRDGTTFPLELGVSEWSRDGRSMFTGILRDVTERHRMEAEIRQAQKIEAIGRLAGGIAHDFNNLLMGVISCCRIAEKAGDPDTALTQVAEIKAAAERGAGLTRQLLTFSRRRELAPEPVLVDEVVERLETLLARLLGEHVELEVQLKAGHGRVLIDPGQVEQILMNLVINSRDAMPGGGHLAVRTAIATCDEPGIGGVGGIGVGRYVSLEVADDGVGMDAETQAKAFDPFFTTKPPTEGTGLGLSTVYGLARQHGGHVHLSSAPGKGTTIRLHLPVTEAEPRPRLGEPRGEEPAREARRATILLVEDDRLVRAGVRHLLEGQGYEVLAASGGASALRLCEEHPGRIDLLLTDVLMPGLTGGELAREVVVRLPGIRTLFMSALPNEVLVEQQRIAPGELSVQKPFSDEELAAGVRKALGDA